MMETECKLMPVCRSCNKVYYDQKNMKDYCSCDNYGDRIMKYVIVEKKIKIELSCCGTRITDTGLCVECGERCI